MEIRIADFDAEFKPFFRGTHTTVAPLNYFAKSKHLKARSLNDDSLQISESTTKQDLLQDVKSSLSRLSFRNHGNRQLPPPPLPPPARVPGIHLRTRYPYYTVPHLILKANETGDGEEARRVYKAFEDSRLFWTKTLKFWEDFRPAYQGTWSKPSLTVGPRTPFAFDNAMDYSIDEGLEWEAEDPAEVELNSVGDDEEDMSELDDDEDDGDGWMVGDDEIEFEEGAEGYTEASATAQSLLKGSASTAIKAEAQDYYTEVGKAGSGSRAQRFTRLVPFQKGPCLETKLGEVDPFFVKYRICLLNGEFFEFDFF